MHREVGKLQEVCEGSEVLVLIKIGHVEGHCKSKSTRMPLMHPNPKLRAVRRGHARVSVH